MLLRIPIEIKYRHLIVADFKLQYVEINSNEIEFACYSKHLQREHMSCESINDDYHRKSLQADTRCSILSLDCLTALVSANLSSKRWACWQTPLQEEENSLPKLI
ncbi:MAG: hypothetical protein BWX92_02499 [Deltaproteobacteria bacterium ADurb.Bin135]|nr:MAG: hypothetical protein BWX92_02499 [Deltaproteobacteria bacterium ADurb.Bin135]